LWFQLWNQTPPRRPRRRLPPGPGDRPSAGPLARDPFRVEARLVERVAFGNSHSGSPHPRLSVSAFNQTRCASREVYRIVAGSPPRGGWVAACGRRLTTPSEWPDGPRRNRGGSLRLSPITSRSGLPASGLILVDVARGVTRDAEDSRSVPLSPPTPWRIHRWALWVFAAPASWGVGIPLWTNGPVLRENPVTRWLSALCQGAAATRGGGGGAENGGSVNGAFMRPVLGTHSRTDNSSALMLDFGSDGATPPVSHTGSARADCPDGGRCPGPSRPVLLCAATGPPGRRQCSTARDRWLRETSRAPG
jgi:hypothetical protein